MISLMQRSIFHLSNKNMSQDIFEYLHDNYE